MINITKFQIGKAGVTQGSIDSLVLAFKKHKQVRVSLLKSSGRNRENMPKFAEEIKVGLEKDTKSSYKVRIIGFTVIVIKNSKDK